MLKEDSKWDTNLLIGKPVMLSPLKNLIRLRDEHTVSVTQLDLMTLYACIIGSRANTGLINCVNSAGDDVFEFKPSDFAEHNSAVSYLMTEPAKAINIGEDLNGIKIYFVARPDFEGITINGRKVEFNEYAPEMLRHIDADGVTMTLVYINGSPENGYTMSAEKLYNASFT